MRIDRNLVQRVEHSAAELSRRQAEAIAATSPASAAAAQQCDGGALIAFGTGRYVNRAVGVGMAGTPAAEIVAALAQFYGPRAVPPSLEVNPWVDPTLVDALAGAGYRFERFRNLYVRPLAASSTTRRPPPDRRGTAYVPIVEVDATTAQGRMDILAGDAPLGSRARQISDEYCIAAATVAGAFDLVALVDGRPAACGSLNIVDIVGWLGGAATLSGNRHRGLQSALLTYRLHAARDAGCAYAAATALADGQSARNLERLGFTLLYSQAVLTAPLVAAAG